MSDHQPHCPKAIIPGTNFGCECIDADVYRERERVSGLESSLAAAQAEVARLKEELERADEASDESEQVRRVVAEAEVAALHHLFEPLIGMLRVRTAGSLIGQALIDRANECSTALSIPSAAEPLLADIRAAVLALARLREWLPQPTDVEDPDDLASLADDSDLSDAALTGLRRWVP